MIKNIPKNIKIYYNYIRGETYESKSTKNYGVSHVIRNGILSFSITFSKIITKKISNLLIFF
jgi:hypothetical protein